jgi:hypothetical protein
LSKLEQILPLADQYGIISLAKKLVNFPVIARSSCVLSMTCFSNGHVHFVEFSNKNDASSRQALKNKCTSDHAKKVTSACMLFKAESDSLNGLDIQ